MSKKYAALLSPLQIGNVVLKNRTCFPNACPHFLQASETFPAEGFLAFYTGMARNGCAYINLGEWNNPNQHKEGADDSLRMQSFDYNDPSNGNYFSQLADDIHFYGSKLCINTQSVWPKGYSMNGGPTMGPGSDGSTTEMLPEDRMHESYDLTIEKLRMFQSFGYDMCSIGMMMGGGPFGSKREDKYGKDPTLYSKELFQAIKKELGQDFLIEITVSTGRGQTPESVGAMAKDFEGLIDIISLRESDVTKSHPTGYTFNEGEHECVAFAEGIKKTGAKVAVAINGGFQDLDEINGYVAEGKADLVCMARAFFADFEYGKKMLEGRGEDVTPCIWCNKCHGTMHAPWLSFCSVNPLMGNEHKLHRMVFSPDRVKKVAVIGGGPAGMEAAVTAAKRGHKVTLFEKSNVLGGQLVHGDVFSFKWPLGKFKNWLVLQCEKEGVDVRLGTEPTPQMIEDGGFDAVIAATGSSPVFPNIEGLKKPDGSLADNVWSIPEVYTGKAKVGKKVVVVGGSESGVETGMYLAENGHDVTVLTRQDEIAHDAPKLHYITMAFIKPSEGPGGFGHPSPAWERYDNFTGITEATTVKVSGGKVTYVKDGKEETIDADSVVICGGMKANQNDALSFADAADEFYITGDCEKVGNIQNLMRSAYAKASQI